MPRDTRLILSLVAMIFVGSCVYTSAGFQSKDQRAEKHFLSVLERGIASTPEEEKARMKEAVRVVSELHASEVAALRWRYSVVLIAGGALACLVLFAADFLDPTQWFKKEPNKAPEPTPPSVTPRATEGDSK